MYFHFAGMSSLIKTVDLAKVFGTGEVQTVALRNVNLEVKEGDFVAIMGPSGCGKTSLLNVLGMLDSPTSGEYWFRGVEVSKLKDKQRAIFRKNNIGFVFQNFNLIDELNIYENVELPLIYLKMKSQERKQRVEDSLARMNILHRRNFFPGQLSGGQQQRVAIARAVVASPGIILADEPTGNLDSVNGEEVMNLLENLNSTGTTIIIVTHSERDADFSHRIVRLFDGKIIHENLLKFNKKD